MAKDLTLAQIFGALGYVFAIVVLMSKHFKDLIDALPSLAKAWKYIQRKWFADAIFRKDLMTKIDYLNIEVQTVKKEVAYNGGSITLSDAVKRLERIVQHHKALKDISDLCDDRIRFRMNSDGGCAFINDAFLKFFGWLESDVLNYAFEDLVHNDDVQDMRVKWQKAISTRTAFKDEQHIRDCNGVYHKCSVRAHPIIIDGSLQEFSGTIDIIE